MRKYFKKALLGLFGIGYVYGSFNLLLVFLNGQNIQSTTLAMVFENGFFFLVFVISLFAVPMLIYQQGQNEESKK